MNFPVVVSVGPPAASRADPVRLEEDDARTPIFGIGDTRYYRYDGETYAVSTRVLGND